MAEAGKGEIAGSGRIKIKIHKRSTKKEKEKKNVLFNQTIQNNVQIFAIDLFLKQTHTVTTYMQDEVSEACMTAPGFQQRGL